MMHRSEGQWKNAPEWWDQDDQAIAERLASIPVPESSRRATHARLLRAAESDLLAPSATLGLRPHAQIVNESHDVETVQLATERLESRETSRRTWVSLATVAAGLVLVLFWWNAARTLSVEQLFAASVESIEKDEHWNSTETINEFVAQSSGLPDVLNRYLREPVDGEIQWRPLSKSEVASSGRLWKVPLVGNKALFVVEFDAPRKIQNVDGQLRILSNPSDGWSTAAIRLDDRVVVFASKSDLRRMLRLNQLV